MRKASSVMKKTLIPGTTPGKASMPHSTTTAEGNSSGSSTSHWHEQDDSKTTTATTTKAAPTTSAPGATTSSNTTTSANAAAAGDQQRRATGKDNNSNNHTDLLASQESTTAMSTTSAELGPDIPILPSTSTFSLAGKDDKGEKQRKKAKNFLDERQKIKSRAQSLWSYIDATNTFDQARFFQENAEQVFHVVYETCMHHIEKIKQRSERPQSWSSKELVNLQKNLLLFRKIFLYVPELMRNGWQRKNIAKILTYILDHGNHLRLRALGFHLLLLWLNDQVVEYPECMELFANAISLDLFVLDEIRPVPAPASHTSNDASNPPEEITASKSHTAGLHFVRKLSERHAERSFGHALERDDRVKKSKFKLHQTLIRGDEQAPLYPSPTSPTYNDSIALLHIFLSNLVRLAYVAAGSPPPPDDYEYPPGDSVEADDGIATGVGIDAATASAKFLFRIFRTYYLTKFTPQVARQLQMDGVPPDNAENYGFPKCPPSILRTLLRFLIGYCLDNSYGSNWSHMPTAISASSPATPILKSIVLSSYETREMLHEILRQSLVLPCTNPSYRDITRGAIHILGVWILGNEDERPSFLRRTGSWTAIASAGHPGSVTRSSSLASVPTTSSFKPSDANTNNNNNDYEDDYKHADANRFLRRYFLMIKLVFEDHWQRFKKHPESNAQLGTEWEGLIVLYKDAINVYRAITVCRGGIDMEWESWELLLHCLLDIQDWFMNQPIKYTCIPVQSLADELSDYICETLLHAFARARISHMELWKELKMHMIYSMRWSQTLGQWTKIMHKLTRVVSSRLYKVEYDISEKHVQDETRNPVLSSSVPTSGRTRNKVRSRHLSIQGDLWPIKHAAGRPLSAGASDGQLVDMIAQDKVFAQADSTKQTDKPGGGGEQFVDATQQQQQQQQPPFTITTPPVMIMRNTSNISLSEKGSSSKASDRRSAYLGDIEDVTLLDEETLQQQQQNNNSTVRSGGSSSNVAGGAGNVKFGIKNIIPTSSFSTNTIPTSSQQQQQQQQQTPVVYPASGVASIGAGSQKRGQGGSNSRRTHGDNEGPMTSSNHRSASVKEDDERKSRAGDWDRRSASSLAIDENMTVSSKSNRTSVSAGLPQGELVALTTNMSAVHERLPAGLGVFRCSEFLNLSNLRADGTVVLGVWKNMLCATGNVNEIEDPQNYAVAMGCVVDIWDTLSWIRSRQPYHSVPRPALYEVGPWLLQATQLSEAYDTGRALAFGCLCRLMSRRSEEPVSAQYYAHFYKAVLKGLSSGDTAVIQAIIQNSGRVFSCCLPGVYILIPSFIAAIESQLLDADSVRDVPTSVRRGCITILGSLVSISNHLADIKLDVSKEWIGQFSEEELSFTDIKVWLKNLLLRLVNADTSPEKIEQNTDAHCMLLGAISGLALDEILQSERPQQDIVYETLLAMVNHLYWSNISIVNTVVDCLNTLAQIYKEDLDPDGVIVQEVLTRVIDALNVHLKYYERNSRDGRGFIISKLFSCLLEWLMVIEPMILSETELCQLVFDVIEYALHVTSEGGSEKLLPHPPVMRSNTSKKKELPFKFKLITEKRPTLHHEYVSVISGSEFAESDHSYVKESAEAVLLHLLHHFNNFAPPFGPATIHSTIVGPGVATEDKSEFLKYQYFSFNDTTIIAFVELPETETEGPQARVIVRDLTGRYVWDAHAEPSNKNLEKPRPRSVTNSLDAKDQGFSLRPGVRVRPTSSEPLDTSMRRSAPRIDKLGELMNKIGECNPDCQTNVNTPIPLTQLQSNMVGRFGEQLNEFLEDERRNNEQQESDAGLWYSKMNILRRKEATDRTDSLHAHLTANFSIRKDFLPAFPHEAEKSHVPFQQCRLLLSHLGFINYDHLKDGSFQMLNKTPALYRDLRGLDRKQGRETMKIAVIYVGPGQEDEQSVLHNSEGSGMYNAFVNSLGWEVDIATHTGYLGGLERNLTNGTRTNYYCSSTLEMIFHDVTKMPTETEDPKQLKKKRHIGNDHVHIVWNEHDRDYRIGTIGGDFGNAQIVVTPMENGLFAIRVYRDPKIPYFGPLFDRMVVSQSILGPLVRATAVSAFRAAIHTNIYSFYKSVFAQRANDVKTIAHRHKVANWTYEQFMEKVFMPNDE
ncbi:hypothetical protein BDB00DRAFT_148787 [Zychaea mexicana]|uniref:uncharacterized protein n=1 Tax=Zychaea mexicana TaxID=64656 RepID=UPI0022FE06CE|nr:uncharacterized protein BDB00DRAFT_148787 [Zychaea mexicana]KAI9484408.1 hypothetical protein BDB00DRAFT_148787 [Zychaea mexicana]